MKAQHTPGPWHVAERLPDTPTVYDLDCYFDVATEDGGIVAEVNTVYEQGLADARLIAAAPELAAALGAMLFYHYGTRELDPEISSHVPAIAARVALVKAGLL